MNIIILQIFYIKVFKELKKNKDAFVLFNLFNCMLNCNYVFYIIK